MVSAEVDESVEVTTSPTVTTNTDTQEVMVNGHEDTSESMPLVNIGKFVTFLKISRFLE